MDKCVQFLSPKCIKKNGNNKQPFVSMAWVGSGMMGSGDVTVNDDIIQLVRECPPGYGGVERVAHELATAWQDWPRGSSLVFLQHPTDKFAPDALPVRYERHRLPSLVLGKVLIPLPSRKLWQILVGRNPLYVHLPCPTLLAVGAIARLIRPKRMIKLHWHAFLEPGSGATAWLLVGYERLALWWASIWADQVITTSPNLAQVIASNGVAACKTIVLPCCLGEGQERRAMTIRRQRFSRPSRHRSDPMRILYIGRLESYKRVDWLIEAIDSGNCIRLDIVGDGPKRKYLELLAASYTADKNIFFHGRISESSKQDLLAVADLLVLPADRSNEAFGIVQLEAIACGVPSLAFYRPRSGMSWVGNLAAELGKTIIKPENLPVLLRELQDRDRLRELSIKASRRYDLLFSRAVWLKRLATLEK